MTHPIDLAKAALRAMLQIAEPEWSFEGAHPMREAAVRRAREALSALEAEGADGWRTPEGWVLAPERATTDMANAMEGYLRQYPNEYPVEGAWHRALSAAPPPPTALAADQEDHSAGARPSDRGEQPALTEEGGVE